jgi:hypothetical protein
VTGLATGTAAVATVPATLVLLLGAAFSSPEQPTPPPLTGTAARPGDAPTPYTGASTGCSLPDPTGTGGCVTGATAWLIPAKSARSPSPTTSVASPNSSSNASAHAPADATHARNTRRRTTSRPTARRRGRERS